LIPQANIAPSRAGEMEAALLTNLAPLPSSVNKSIRALDCGVKLGPTGPYVHYRDRHPYIEWLVSVHYPSVSPPNILDDQTNLVPGSSPPIGDARIRVLADILEDRL